MLSVHIILLYVLIIEIIMNNNEIVLGLESILRLEFKTSTRFEFPTKIYIIVT